MQLFKYIIICHKLPPLLSAIIGLAHWIILYSSLQLLSIFLLGLLRVPRTSLNCWDRYSQIKEDLFKDYGKTKSWLMGWAWIVSLGLHKYHWTYKATYSWKFGRCVFIKCRSRRSAFLTDSADRPWFILHRFCGAIPAKESGHILTSKQWFLVLCKLTLHNVAKDLYCAFTPSLINDPTAYQDEI